jgi:hypothetical protein
MADIGLDEYLAELRRELRMATFDAKSEDLQFELGAVEVSLSVKVVRSGGPKVSFKFVVVDAGVDASLSKESVQTVKLTLTPVLKGERSVYVDGQASEIEE